jgi:hypothetical protein
MGIEDTKVALKDMSLALKEVEESIIIVALGKMCYDAIGLSGEQLCTIALNIGKMC